MPLQPFTGTFGTAELRHLLRRTLFGASQEDLTAFQGKTLIQVVDELLNINTNITTPPVFFQEGFPLHTKDLIDNTPTVPNDTLTYGGLGTYPAKSTLGMDWVTQPNWIKVSGVSPTGQGSASSWFTNYFPPMYSFTAWWGGNMLHQERTIKEKMILFLHNLVPVNPKNDGALLLEVYEYYKLLNRYALGNYKDFIFDMTFNPMMLRYLDGKHNKSGSVNENYARELQELFTVGKPVDSNQNSYSSYKQEDVAAIAKLLTGWDINGYWKCDNFPTGHDKLYPIKFEPLHYDNSTITLTQYYGNVTIPAIQFNNTDTAITKGSLAALRFKSVLNIIFSKDDVAKHIVRKLYRYFVYSDITTNNLSLCSPNIEQNIIVPLANTLKINNYNLKIVLKELLTSKHFFEPINRGCMIKNPMDFVVGTLRTFKVDGLLPPIWNDETGTYVCSSKDGYRSIARYTFWMDWVTGKCNDLNWGLLNAPDVAGLPAYHQASSYHQLWINADTVNKRKRFLGLKNGGGLLYYGGFSINSDPNSPQIQRKYIPNFIAVTKSIIPTMHPILFTRNMFIDRLLDHFLSVRPNDTIIDSIFNKWESQVEWDSFKVAYNSNTLSQGDQDKLKSIYRIILELEEFQLM